MSVFPTKVLLATDGSEDAALASRAAVDLSRRAGAELHVVHAWQTVPSPHFESWISNAFEREARRILDEQVKEIETSGGNVAGDYLKKGPSHEAITGLAREIEADLIVMGSRGLGPVKRILLGSVSEGVVHHARVPVLLLRGGERAWPPVRVVVGEDASDNARRAGELAARVAGLFGADMLLVHVVPLQWLGLKAKFQGTDTVDEVMRRAQEHLEERAGELEGSPVGRPLTRTVIGYPAAVLAGMAGEERPTLLTVGSRGLNAVKRTMLGSVSSNALRTAEGPVLVVPPASRRDHAP